MKSTSTNTLTYERLKTLLDYDPESGVFTRKSGKTVGTLNGLGYTRISLDGKEYYCHRLAWLYAHGEFPPNDIDHVNGDRSDNRIVNLRPATRSENMRNRSMRSDNSTGYCGVRTNAGKYCAALEIDDKTYHLGRYDSPEIAAAVYAFAAVECYRHFAKPHFPEWLIPSDLNHLRAIGGNMVQIRKCLAAVVIHNAQQREMV